MEATPGKEIETRKRPPTLTLLCIFTFAGSGLMFLAFFSAGVFHTMFSGIQGLPEAQRPALEMIQNTSRWIFLTGAGIYSMSFMGALLMWNMRKAGFHLYTLAQFAQLFLTTFALFPGRFAMGDMMLSATFVLLYGIHLSRMS